MVITILLCVLFVLLSCIVVLFLFGILLPALKGSTDLSFMVFPSRQAQYKLGTTREYPINKDYIAHINIAENVDCSKRFNFVGKASCKLNASYFDSFSCYKNDCLDVLDCVSVCPQNAIIIKDKKLCVTASCIGCGLCIPVCPKGLISLEKIAIENDKDNKKHTRFWLACDTFIRNLEQKFK